MKSPLKYWAVLLFALSLHAEVRKGYLIITKDSLVDAVQDFVQWKTEQGFVVTVATVEQISQDTADIRRYIVQAMDTMNPRPEYVLLIGNIMDIPSYMRFFDIGVPAMFPFDFFYVASDTLSMETYAPVGRIPFSSPVTVSYVLSKIIFYEKTPLARSARWLSRGIVSFNDSMVVPLKMLTAQWMLGNGMFDVDSTSARGMELRIDTVLSSGYGFHNHRGYPIWVNRMPQLHNDSMPFVSIFLTCNSANFGLGNRDGPYLLRNRTGEMTGAAAVVGCATSIIDSTNTILRLRNLADSVINHSIWIDSVVSIGAATELARMAIPVSYGHISDTSKLAAWELTILGDPSLNVWRGVPQTILLSLPDTVQVNTPFTVTASAPGVSRSAITLAVTNGTELIFADTIHEDGTIELTIPDTWDFTVTASSPYALPAQKTLRVVEHYSQSGPRIFIRAISLSDMDGNGRFMPFDTVLLSLSYMNVGVDTARNMQLDAELIGSLNPIQTSTQLGELPPDATDSVSLTLGVVSDSSIDGEEFRVRVGITCDGCPACSATTSGWVSRWQIEDAELRFRELQADTNSFIDPGDTIELFLSFYQGGSVTFGPDGLALLRCSDAGVQVLDSVIEHITVPPDHGFDDTTDAFVVSVPPDFPDGDSLHFTVVFESGGIEHPESFSYQVGGREYLAVAISVTDINDMQAADSLLRQAGYHGFATLGLEGRYLNHINDFRAIYIFAASDHVLSYRDLIPVLVDYLNAGGNLWIEAGLSLWILDNELKNRAGVSFGNQMVTADTIYGAAGSFAEGFVFRPGGPTLPVLSISDTEHTSPLLTAADSTIGFFHQDSTSRMVGFPFSPVGFLTSDRMAEFYANGMNYFVGVHEDGVDLRRQNQLMVLSAPIASGAVELQIAPSKQRIELSVFDVTGREVRRLELEPSASVRTVKLNFNSSGVYFLLARDGRKIESRKLIILR